MYALPVKMGFILQDMHVIPVLMNVKPVQAKDIVWSVKMDTILNE